MARVYEVSGSGLAEAIAAAVQSLHGGGIVIFPTDTVYGVGADIRNAPAVRRLVALKRRSPVMPLMAHCADELQVEELVIAVPPVARALIGRFWPGPLALVFRASAAVPIEVTAGTGTIGIRMVAHPVGRRLIAEFGRAIAGTSVNISGEPATSRFAAISPALLAGADVALDAGVCGTDVASTVLDLTVSPPRIVRPGAVPVAAIEAELGLTL